MMTAMIHQKIDGEMNRALQGMGQTPGDTCRMPVTFHPDALFQDQVPDSEAPDRNAAVELERFDVYQPPRLHRAAAPAIGK